jgi:formylglycine-generating enzyme required for sulfatase activity
VTSGFVSGITVTSGGVGYIAEPLVTIADGGGNGASAKAVLSNGRVVLIIILTAGSGYSGLPDVIVSPPSMAEVELSPRIVLYGENDSKATVETSSVLTGGWGLFSNLVARREGVVVSNYKTDRESQFYRIKESGDLKSINIVETATAISTVHSGFVTGISLVNQGSGYVAEPKVTVVGGGGLGATARAFISGNRIASIVVLTAGFGYTTPPAIDIEPPPMRTRLGVKLGKALRATGQPLSKLRIESSITKNGPWAIFTNLALLSSGVAVIDLMPGLENRFYKISEIVPPGTVGFVWVNSGSFMMGSPESEVGRNSFAKWEEVQHRVTITRGFWISDHEVTQGEYRSVMGRNPNTVRDDNLPVTNVKWGEAVQYCEVLTNREKLANRITDRQAYRLPTEAEWEYACRAGSTDARYGNLNEIAWITTGIESSLRSVCTKKPNAFGLYDMLGNAWEWCSDWWWDYPQFDVVDPTGPLNPIGGNGPGLKIVRGAPWNFGPGNLRSAGRFKTPPDTALSCMGFRAVLEEIW